MTSVFEQTVRLKKLDTSLFVLGHLLEKIVYPTSVSHLSKLLVRELGRAFVVIRVFEGKRMSMSAREMCSIEKLRDEKSGKRLPVTSARLAERIPARKDAGSWERGNGDEMTYI